MSIQKNLMVTVSGGRSSAFMARHIQQSEKYKDYNKVYVFCNTGMERPETIDFLKNIEMKWEIPLKKIEGVYSNTLGVGVGYKIVDYDNISMTAKPFSEAIEHINKGDYNGLPNSGAPYCSSMLKTIPSKKLCDKLFGVNNYYKAIGFRSEDMPHRVSFAQIKDDKKNKRKLFYPLIEDFDIPVGLEYLNQFWKREKFKLELHGKYGNCELCWKKSDNNLVDVIKHGTRFIDWFEKEEEKYGNTSFRDWKSIKDLVKMASLPSTMQIDFSNKSEVCVCSF